MPLLVDTPIFQTSAPLRQGVILEPSGKWSLDYGENSCVLAGRFGDGEDAVTVGWRLIPFSGLYQLVVQRSSKSSKFRRGAINVSIGPKSFPEVAYKSYPLRGVGQARLEASLNSNLFDDIQEGATMSVSPSGEPSFVIKLENIKSAFGALSRCGDDTLVRWGIDPMERQRVVVPPAAVNTSSFVVPGSYPRKALAAGAFGSVSVLLAIDQTGKVTSCRVVQSSETASLDAAACDFMVATPRFTAGKDAAGNPIAAHLFTGVNWDLGGWIDDQAYRRLVQSGEKTPSARKD